MTVVLSTTLFCLVGCSNAEKKADVASLIKSSVEARLIGHEDLAANYIKEAFDSLPPVNTPQRVLAVDQLYSETLILAKDLRKSGRLSLSDTLYDKAIEIEQESTLSSKQSARKLKQETEKMFDIEENILVKATGSNDLRESENRLRKITKHLEMLLKQGDYAKVESDGQKHLQIVRNACGTGSPVYENARQVYVSALLRLGMSKQALDLMGSDAKELKSFSDKDLENADAEAIQNAYFLDRFLCEFANVQLQLGDLSGAEKSARQSVDLAGTLGGKMVLEKAYAMLALSRALKAQGEFKPALDLAASAMPMMEQHGAYLEDKVRCLQVIAEVEETLDLKKEAARDFNKLIEIALTSPVTGDSPLALAVASAYFRANGNEKKCLELKNKSIANAMSEGDKFETRSVFKKLGDSARKASRTQEAVSFYEKALRYSSKSQEMEIKEKIASCK